MIERVSARRYHDFRVKGDVLYVVAKTAVFVVVRVTLYFLTALDKTTSQELGIST